jgi:hypothetical protein
VGGIRASANFLVEGGSGPIGVGLVRSPIEEDSPRIGGSTAAAIEQPWPHPESQDFGHRLLRNGLGDPI